ncbi:hypothetical protein BGZ76_009873 [Entomortierella beljakovae]|nr:hypothetical protein BGZ76_009873 [Entomortierella beljakovae]
MTTAAVKYLRVSILFLSILDLIIVIVTFVNELVDFWDGTPASLITLSFIFGTYIYIIKSKVTRPSNGLSLFMYLMSIVTFALKIALWDRANVRVVNTGASTFDLVDIAPYYTDAIFGSILACLVPIEVHLSIVSNQETKAETEEPKLNWV